MGNLETFSLAGYPEKGCCSLVARILTNVNGTPAGYLVHTHTHTHKRDLPTLTTQFFKHTHTQISTIISSNMILSTILSTHRYYEGTYMYMHIDS